MVAVLLEKSGDYYPVSTPNHQRFSNTKWDCLNTIEANPAQTPSKRRHSTEHSSTVDLADTIVHEVELLLTVQKMRLYHAPQRYQHGDCVTDWYRRAGERHNSIPPDNES